VKGKIVTSSVQAFDWQGGVSQAWTSVATFVPKLVAFLVILIIGWFVAKLVAAIVAKVLGKIGFDRVVDRGGLRDVLARGNLDASGILAKLAYYAILLMTLLMAFRTFGDNPVSTLLSDLVAWLPKLFVALVIIVIAAAVASGVKAMITNVLGGLSYGKLLGSIASVLIWGLGAIAALNQIGIATAVTTPVLIAVLATVGGIAVVGVGGGLIRPMQDRWERWIDNFENEMPALKDQVRGGRTQPPGGQPLAYQQAEQPGQYAPGQTAEPGQHARDPRPYAQATPGQYPGPGNQYPQHPAADSYPPPLPGYPTRP
jgi:hypothetical protein